MPMPLTATVVKGDPVVRFLLLAVVLYVGWYALYEFVLHPMGVLDRATIDSLISWASVILTGLGYELIREHQGKSTVVWGYQAPEMTCTPSK